MEFQLLLPTSKLVPIHTRKEQFALTVVPMQVPAQPGLSPVGFFLVGMTREHPFAASLVAWLLQYQVLSRPALSAPGSAAPTDPQRPQRAQEEDQYLAHRTVSCSKGWWPRTFSKKKRKIEHRKHLCLSSVQVYFSNTSHTTNISVWLLRQNRRKEK